MYLHLDRYVYFTTGQNYSQWFVMIIKINQPYIKDLISIIKAKQMYTVHEE